MAEQLSRIIIGSIFYRPVYHIPYKNMDTWAFSLDVLNGKNEWVRHERIFKTREECEAAYKKLRVQQALDAQKKLKKQDKQYELEKINQETTLKKELIKIKQNKKNKNYISKHGIYSNNNKDI